MKVMCIDASKGKNFAFTPTFNENDILEVIYVSIDDKGFHYYRILNHELSKEGEFVDWGCKRFIPLSDIDEMELVNEKELVNQ